MQHDVILTAASYHWRCPECGQDHFERFVAERVTCPNCGSILDVRSVEHRFSTSRDERQPRLL
jgi:predicted RNA-binding Zn-ribbon protein involved in translation (DUF1610 family)